MKCVVSPILDLVQMKPTMLHIAGGVIKQKLECIKLLSVWWTWEWYFTNGVASHNGLSPHHPWITLPYFMFASTTNTVTKDSSEQCCLCIPYLMKYFVYWHSHIKWNHCTKMNSANYLKSTAIWFLNQNCEFQMQAKGRQPILMYTLLWHKSDILPIYTPMWYCRNLYGDDRCMIWWWMVYWHNGHFTTKCYTITNTAQAMYMYTVMRLLLHFRISKFLMYALIRLDRTSLIMKYVCVTDSTATCCDNGVTRP